ncbi:MAG: CinA family protein [Arenicella sp.]
MSDHLTTLNALYEQQSKCLAELIAQLQKQQKIVTAAESCTGGLLAGALTSMPGSSDYFDAGFVTYSNQAKKHQLGVLSATLLKHGAVSEETAREMLIGALANSRAHIGISITGIAGPSGGSADKPVGTVCFGWGDSEIAYTSTEFFTGDRDLVRAEAVINAIEKLYQFLTAKNSK